MSKASKRRDSLFAAGTGVFGTAVVAAGAAMSQAAAPAPALLELKIALADDTVNPVTDSVIRLADTLGYYKAHGVKLTIIALQGTPQAVAALNSGDVDLADIAVDASLRLRATNGVALRAA